MQNLSRSLAAATRPITPRRRFAPRLVSMLITWQRRLRERDQLAAMTERELRDAGITRFEAAALARRPFWRA